MTSRGLPLVAGPMISWADLASLGAGLQRGARGVADGVTDVLIGHPMPSCAARNLDADNIACHHRSINICCGGDAGSLGTGHPWRCRSWHVGGIDSGMLRISTPDYWNARGLVYVRASTDPDPGLGTNRDEDYVISGFKYATVNSVVCSTGQTNGTDCGLVTSALTTGSFNTAFGPFNYTDVAEVTGLCRAGGDSGGPYHRIGYAYGTQTSRSSNTSGCRVKYTRVAAGLDLNNVNLVRN